MTNIHAAKVNDIQSVPGVKVTTSGFNSRADSESKTPYTHGTNSQRFWSYVPATHGRRFSGHTSQKMHPSRRRTHRTICL